MKNTDVETEEAQKILNRRRTRRTPPRYVVKLPKTKYKGRVVKGKH